MKSIEEKTENMATSLQAYLVRLIAMLSGERRMFRRTATLRLSILL
jgi:hypothetical protein